MADRYELALKDPELLALREEIGLIDARLTDLLGRVDTGESGAAWTAAGDAFRAVRLAILEQDPLKLEMALLALETAINRGKADYLAWADVRQWLEQRRKIVESERKRLVEMRQMLTAEQAMALVAAVIDTVRQHVTDRDALAAIADDIGRLTHRESAEPVA